MSNTPILSIVEVAENQTNKFNTINNALIKLEAAANAKATKTISGTTAWTLTQSECQSYAYYVTSGGTGNYDVIFKATPDGSNNANRLFVFKNTTSYTATLKADSAGNTVSVAAGASVLAHQAGVDMTALIRWDGSTTAPYEVGCSITGQPSDGVETLRFVATRTIDFAANFSGSRGSCGTNPTATATMDVKKNGTTIGSISISTGGAFTFTTTGGTTKQLVAGDVLTIVTPSPQDATLANVGVLLSGTRTL